MKKTTDYTCNDYRQEMVLLALRQKLSRPDLPEEEKKAIREEIRELEIQMGMA